MKEIMLFILALSLCLSVKGQIESESDEVALAAPMDDIVERRISKERRLLNYSKLQENDVFWSKRVWRVIDVREKINLAFKYEPQPLIKIILDGVENGDIDVYGTEDDKFTYRLSQDEVQSMIFETDTIPVIDPETYKTTYKVVSNSLDYQSVKRYRIKEMWYFDSKSSSLNVRILGVAPLKEVYGERGEFRYETPMFWIYFPHARSTLARHTAYNPHNDESQMSWTDIFDMRYFSSNIIKVSNEFDRKIDSYLSGTDRLLEGQKIKDEIFNFEQDMWEY